MQNSNQQEIFTYIRDLGDQIVHIDTPAKEDLQTVTVTCQYRDTRVGIGTPVTFKDHRGNVIATGKVVSEDIDDLSLQVQID